MRHFYFVGGPVEGQEEVFLKRLAELGGPPSGWHVYPHASRDGRALHVVEAEDRERVLAHLAHFDPIYERGPIVEVAPRR